MFILTENFLSAFVSTINIHIFVISDITDHIIMSDTTDYFMQITEKF